MISPAAPVRRRAGVATARQALGRDGLGACVTRAVVKPERAGQEVGEGQSIYTAAQADRGITLFRSKCASCHAPNRFTDDLFYTSFAGKPLWEMFDVISDTMPEDNPGGMKKEEYADVIAYLLKLNNFPAGATELPIDKDALSAIVMEKP